MPNLILMMLSSLLAVLRTQAGLQAEILSLRHQLIVLQRTQKKKRLILRPTDRWLWVWLSRVWLDWRFRPGHRQTCDRHRLASTRFPLVLDLEDSSRSNRTSQYLNRNSRSDPIHQSR